MCGIEDPLDAGEHESEGKDERLILASSWLEVAP